MRDLGGRVARLEKRLGSSREGGMLVLTIPYGVDPETGQKRALEEKGYTERDIAGREVVFITSYATEP